MVISSIQSSVVLYGLRDPKSKSVMVLNWLSPPGYMNDIKFLGAIMQLSDLETSLDFAKL